MHRIEFRIIAVHFIMYLFHLVRFFYSSFVSIYLFLFAIYVHPFDGWHKLTMSLFSFRMSHCYIEVLLVHSQHNIMHCIFMYPHKHTNTHAISIHIISTSALSIYHQRDSFECGRSTNRFRSNQNVIRINKYVKALLFVGLCRPINGIMDDFVFSHFARFIFLYLFCSNCYNCCCCWWWFWCHGITIRYGDANKWPCLHAFFIHILQLLKSH